MKGDVSEEYSEDESNDDAELFQQNLTAANYFERLLSKPQVADAESVKTWLIEEAKLRKVNIDKDDLYA